MRWIRTPYLMTTSQQIALEAQLNKVHTYYDAQCFFYGTEEIPEKMQSLHKSVISRCQYYRKVYTHWERDWVIKLLMFLLYVLHC